MVYFIHQRDHENIIISRGDTNGSLPKIQTYSSDQYLFDDVNILLGLKNTKLRIKIHCDRDSKIKTAQILTKYENVVIIPSWSCSLSPSFVH